MSRCFPYPPPGYNPAGNTLSGTGNLEYNMMKKSKELRKKSKYHKSERKDDVIPPEEAGERSCVTEEHGDPSSDRSTENSAKRKRPEFSATSGEDKKKRKMAERYRDLIENWKPPVLSLPDYGDDDDWLSGSRKQMVNPAAITGGCSGSSAVWPPRAQFLPDVGIYARPYVVPF